MIVQGIDSGFEDGVGPRSWAGSQAAGCEEKFDADESYSFWVLAFRMH